MKFGVELDRMLFPLWKSYYVDYEGLKELLYEAREHFPYVGLLKKHYVYIEYDEAPSEAFKFLISNVSFRFRDLDSSSPRTKYIGNLKIVAVREKQSAFEERLLSRQANIIRLVEEAFRAVLPGDDGEDWDDADDDDDAKKNEARANDHGMRNGADNDEESFEFVEKEKSMADYDVMEEEEGGGEKENQPNEQRSPPFLSSSANASSPSFTSAAAASAKHRDDAAQQQGLRRRAVTIKNDSSSNRKMGDVDDDFGVGNNTLRKTQSHAVYSCFEREKENEEKKNGGKTLSIISHGEEEGEDEDEDGEEDFIDIGGQFDFDLTSTLESSSQNKSRMKNSFFSAMLQRRFGGQTASIAEPKKKANRTSSSPSSSNAKGAGGKNVHNAFSPFSLLSDKLNALKKVVDGIVADESEKGNEEKKEEERKSKRREQKRREANKRRQLIRTLFAKYFSAPSVNPKAFDTQTVMTKGGGGGRGEEEEGSATPLSSSHDFVDASSPINQFILALTGGEFFASIVENDISNHHDEDTTAQHDEKEGKAPDGASNQDSAAVTVFRAVSEILLAAAVASAAFVSESMTIGSVSQQLQSSFLPATSVSVAAAEALLNLLLTTTTTPSHSPQQTVELQESIFSLLRELGVDVPSHSKGVKGEEERPKSFSISRPAGAVPTAVSTICSIPPPPNHYELFHIDPSTATLLRRCARTLSAYEKKSEMNNLTRGGGGARKRTQGGGVWSRVSAAFCGTSSSSADADDRFVRAIMNDDDIDGDDESDTDVNFHSFGSPQRIADQMAPVVGGGSTNNHRQQQHVFNNNNISNNKQRNSLEEYGGEMTVFTKAAALGEGRDRQGNEANSIDMKNQQQQQPLSSLLLSILPSLATTASAVVHHDESQGVAVGGGGNNSGESDVPTLAKIGSICPNVLRTMVNGGESGSLHHHQHNPQPAYDLETATEHFASNVVENVLDVTTCGYADPPLQVIPSLLPVAPNGSTNPTVVAATSMITSNTSNDNASITSAATNGAGNSIRRLVVLSPHEDKSSPHISIGNGSLTTAAGGAGASNNSVHRQAVTMKSNGGLLLQNTSLTPPPAAPPIPMETKLQQQQQQQRLLLPYNSGGDGYSSSSGSAGSGGHSSSSSHHHGVPRKLFALIEKQKLADIRLTMHIYVQNKATHADGVDGSNGTQKSANSSSAAQGNNNANTATPTTTISADSSILSDVGYCNPAIAHCLYAFQRSVARPIAAAVQTEIEKVSNFYLSQTHVLCRAALLCIDSVKLWATMNPKERSQLRTVYRQTYLTFRILQQYCDLNILALGKFLKKADKNLFQNALHNYRDAFEALNFRMGHSSRIMLLQDVMVAKLAEHAMGGSNKKAHNFLQTTRDENSDFTFSGDSDGKKNSGGVASRLGKNKATTFTTSAFLGGLLLSLSAMIILLLSEGGAHGSQSILDSDLFSKTFAQYLIFVPLVFALPQFLFSINVMIYERFGINFAFMFELDPIFHFTGAELMRDSLIYFVVWAACVYVFLRNSFKLLACSGCDAAHRPPTEDVFTPSVAPLWAIMPLFLFTWLAIAFKNRYISSERRPFWSAEVFWRILTTPCYTVRFPDFFVCNYITSMTTVLFEIQFYWCTFSTDPNAQCTAGRSMSLCILNSLPNLWRMMQSVKRYFAQPKATRKPFPNLVNGGKYLTGVIQPLVWTGWAVAKYHKCSNEVLTAMYVLSFAAQLLTQSYKYCWDVVVDAGIFIDYGNGYEWRRERVYKAWWPYICFMIVDFVLRWRWLVTYYVQLSYKPAWFFFMWSTIELIRRSWWSAFRVENEHVNNTEHYRATKLAPIPVKTIHEWDVFAADQAPENFMNKKKRNEFSKEFPAIKGVNLSSVTRYFASLPEEEKLNILLASPLCTAYKVPSPAAAPPSSSTAMGERVPSMTFSPAASDDKKEDGEEQLTQGLLAQESSLAMRSKPYMDNTTTTTIVPKAATNTAPAVACLVGAKGQGKTKFFAELPEEHKVIVIINHIGADTMNAFQRRMWELYGKKGEEDGETMNTN